MSQLLWPKGKLLAITSKIYRKFYPFLGNQMSKCQLELTDIGIILLALHKTYRYSTCLHSMPSPVFKKKKGWGFLSLFRTITIFSLSKMLLMTHSVVPPIKNISGS